MMADDQNAEDSVFDFLYVDIRRIGILSSQKGSDGILTELSRVSEADSELGGGFDLKIVKSNVKEGERRSLQQRFDAQWLIPLRFLDVFNSQIVRDVSNARIGDLVLVRGNLAFIDFAIMKAAWDVPAVKTLAIQGAMGDADGRNSKERNEAKREAEKNVSLMFDIVKLMPHISQISLANVHGSFWGTLDEASLMSSTSELTLKHGNVIEGLWNIVGILDALPDDQFTSGDIGLDSQIAAANTLQIFGGSPIASVAMMFSPMAKGILGKPEASFGITPLAIFREIGG